MGASASSLNEEDWLKKTLKTSREHAPHFSKSDCLQGNDVNRKKSEIKRLYEEAKKVVSTPRIDDTKIKSWAYNESGMERAKDHFIVLTDINVEERRVEVEFIPFDEISTDVYGWSYRWATPVNYSDLVTISVVDCESKDVLYYTNIFEMELHMLESDVNELQKVWIDKICVPQKSPYTGYHIAAMGTFYQNATTVLREVRDPESLPMFDYLSRAWTYQEARYGKTLCDHDPPLYLAREWAEMLWGRQFVVGVSGLLYQIPNVMARTMDSKVGPNNITYDAMLNCLGSGHFFTFFVKNYRRHEGFPSSHENNKHLEFLEDMGDEMGESLDEELKEAFQNLPREVVRKGDKEEIKVIGPNDCRVHPEMSGVLWKSVVAMRNNVSLDIDEDCLPEIVAEMSLRNATFQSDRFIGTWAVLMKHMDIDMVIGSDNFPLANETWQKVAGEYNGGLMLQRDLAFMLYGPYDIAGMVPPQDQLPSGIIGCADKWHTETLLCERVVKGIGDGSTDECQTQPNLTNAWAVHVSDEGEASLLLRHDVTSRNSPYRRLAVIGINLCDQEPHIFNQFCGLFQLGASSLFDGDKLVEHLSVERSDIDNAASMISGCFRDFLKLLRDGKEPGPDGTYTKNFNKKHCIPPENTSLEMTPLRETVFIVNKMSKNKDERFWTRFEELEVIIGSS